MGQAAGHNQREEEGLWWVVGIRAFRKMGRNGRKEKQQNQILLENVITGANEMAQLVKLSYKLHACAHSTRTHASEKTPQ